MLASFSSVRKPLYFAWFPFKSTKIFLFQFLMSALKNFIRDHASCMASRGCANFIFLCALSLQKYKYDEILSKTWSS